MPTYNKFQKHEILRFISSCSYFPQGCVYLHFSFLTRIFLCVYLSSQSVFLNTHEHFSAWIKIPPKHYKHLLPNSSCIYHLTISRFQTQNKSTSVFLKKQATILRQTCTYLWMLELVPGLRGRTHVAPLRCLMHKLVIDLWRWNEGKDSKYKVRNANGMIEPYWRLSWFLGSMLIP